MAIDVKAVAMALFGNIGTVKTGVGVNYAKEGQYWVRIDGMKLFLNRKNEQDFAINYTIIKVLDDNHGQADKVGEEVSQCEKVSNDYFLRNFKTMVCAICNVKPEEVTMDTCVSILDERQLLAGLPVELTVKQVPKKTQKPILPGQPQVLDCFTRYTWKREVTKAEVEKNLTAEQLARFFPKGVMTIGG